MLADLGLFLRNQNRLRRFHNRHRGERCFIIGNGPSLRSMDLKPLRHECTFGLNRIYLLFPSLGFETTYLAAVNRHVIEQFSRDILALRSTRFLSWYARDAINRTEQVLYLRPGTAERFSNNPVWTPVWEGATVTFVAMQLAYFMGFSRVILIGVDHAFHDTGPAHSLVVSQGADENHFHPDYFGHGVRWQLPDLTTSERAYSLARDAFARAGREILDATVGGKLTVFPKIDYTQLFEA